MAAPLASSSVPPSVLLSGQNSRPESEFKISLTCLMFSKIHFHRQNTSFPPYSKVQTWNLIIFLWYSTVSKCYYLVFNIANEPFTKDEHETIFPTLSQWSWSARSGPARSYPPTSFIGGTGSVVEKTTKTHCWVNPSTLLFTQTNPIDGTNY